MNECLMETEPAVTIPQVTGLAATKATIMVVDDLVPESVCGVEPGK